MDVVGNMFALAGAVGAGIGAVILTVWGGIIGINKLKKKNGNGNGHHPYEKASMNAKLDSLIRQGESSHEVMSRSLGVQEKILERTDANASNTQQLVAFRQVDDERYSRELSDRQAVNRQFENLDHQCDTIKKIMIGKG